MKSLVEVIDDFFEKCIYGNRKDIMDFVSYYIKTDSVTDANGKILTQVARTTIYDNLKNLYSFNVVEKESKSGRPTNYFFKPTDETEVKPLLLAKDNRTTNTLKFIDVMLGYHISKNSIYQRFLKDSFYKSGMNNFREYLRHLKANPEDLKNMIWAKYLKKTQIFPHCTPISTV